MLTMVLGAPGSGKTTITPVLRRLLPRHVVIDWDDFMSAAARLSGREVPSSPELWDPYRQLVRSIVESVLPVAQVVVFGVSTPDELVDWPSASWVLLDCDDDERAERLAARNAGDANEAIVDATSYRRLGLPVVDTSRRPVEDIAAQLAEMITPPAPAGLQARS
jgi:predicted kinase